jgi:hypothetical protein
MSDHDDAMAALAEVVPIGEDHPTVDALARAVTQAITERPVRPAPSNAPAELLLMAGVARPGDVLVVSSPDPLSAEHAETIRAQLRTRLPLLADVVVLSGATVACIFRGGPP